VRKVLDVAAGVLADSCGHILVAQRPLGKSMAGYWEFPGGKLQPGETPLEALVRELREELGIDVGVARHVLRSTHSYPDVDVHLHVWKVLTWAGKPAGQEGQALQWLPAAELLEKGLLPADAPVVDALLANSPAMTVPVEACFGGHPAP